MTDFDRIREEGERISREEGYRVLLAEIAARDKEIEKLREAIRRLADQDATMSVQGGNVTVTMDATLDDAEREAVEFAYSRLTADTHYASVAATLRGLLERLGGER